MCVYVCVLLKLVIVDTHERNLSAAALVEFVTTGLTAETLEQKLSAEVTEGQCEESLPHLSIKQTNIQSRASKTLRNIISVFV